MIYNLCTWYSISEYI